MSAIAAYPTIIKHTFNSAINRRVVDTDNPACFNARLNEFDRGRNDFDNRRLQWLQPAPRNSMQLSNIYGMT
ncbi:MAG: hypothetical protein L0229_12105 [Blastocatellia bacterium]|nr:hypothetical protein [Blastocatellia bacterium]